MKRSEKARELLAKLEHSPHGFVTREKEIGRLPLLGDMGQAAEFILREIEAAGFVWGPEEEPLPERIYASTHVANVPVLCAKERVISEEGYAEAVRRYNLVPEVRAMVSRFVGDRPMDPLVVHHFGPAILALLDGREPAANPPTYQNSREQRLEDCMEALWSYIRHPSRGRTLASLEAQVQAARDRGGEPVA